METLKKLARNFKKHSKIYIAMAMVLSCVFGVMFGINSFAYETDKMSYTITEIGSATNNYQTISNNTNYIDISLVSDNRLYIKNENGFAYKQYYLFINFIYLSNGSTTTRDYAQRTTLTPWYVNNTNSARQGQGVFINTYQYNYNSTNNYYTICIPLTFTTNWNETMNYVYIQNWFYLGSSGGASLSGYDYRLYNIDLVTSEEIGLSQYYDTYYSNIENQYNQLLDDFDDLQDDFTQLETNYNNLDDDYNELQDNYDYLETNYNNLLENGLNDLYGGIYSSLNGTLCKLYNTDNPSLSYLKSINPVLSETISINSFAYKIPVPIASAIENHDYGLSRNCMILLSLNMPMYFKSLTFSRIVNNQNRNIYLYFDDGTSETLTIFDSGDYSTKSITWINTNNKYITNIVYDNEVGYDYVYSISCDSDGQAYSNGYDYGYALGYQNRQVELDEYIKTLEDKVNSGFTQAYNQGWNDADVSGFSQSGFAQLFNSILSYPVNFIKEVFNFEFMGVNISAFITFILSISIIAFIVKYFRNK